MFFKPGEKIICTGWTGWLAVTFHFLSLSPDPAGWLVSGCNVISVKHYCDEHHSPGHHPAPGLKVAALWLWLHASPKFCPQNPRSGPCSYPGVSGVLWLRLLYWLTPPEGWDDAQLWSEGLTTLRSTPGQISHKPNVDGVGLPISQIIPEIHHLLASLLEF